VSGYFSRITGHSGYLDRSDEFADALSTLRSNVG
jgi:hypothetical protein